MKQMHHRVFFFFFNYYLLEKKIAIFFIIEYIIKIKNFDFQKLHLAPSQKLS